MFGCNENFLITISLSAVTYTSVSYISKVSYIQGASQHGKADLFFSSLLSQ